jgi:peptide/nickel transport system substrate-binding protein
MRPLVVIVAVVAALFVAACGGDESDSGDSGSPATGTAATTSVAQQGIADEVTVGGTLALGAIFEPQTLNPNLRADDGANRVSAMIYQQLVTADFVHGTGEVFPALAESWTVSPDAKTFTFKLAENAQWHDGKPVTAEDVEWTFNQIKDEEGASIRWVQDIATTTVEDPHTITFELEKPNAAFLPGLGRPESPWVLPKHVFEGSDWNENPANQKPIGSGPFKFDSWERGSFVRVVANEDFYLGRPPLDAIVTRYLALPALLTAFEAGEIHYSYDLFPGSELKRMEQDDRFNIKFYFPSLPMWTGFNMKEKPFDDVRVRKAFAMAIDREGISERAYAGFAPPNFNTIPTSWATDDSIAFEYDPAEAERLLDQAGYEEDASGKRINVTLSYAAVMGQDSSSTLIKDQLSKVGVNVQLDSMDWPTFASKVYEQRNFHMTLGGGYAGPDPDAFGDFVAEGGAINVMGYDDPKVNQAFVDGRSIPDQDERKPYYEEIQRELFEDVPRFNLVDFAYHQPVLSCVKHPFFDDTLTGQPNNVYQGFLYTSMEGC